LTRIEPGAKRVRAYLSGCLVADTIHPILVWEKPFYPTYYVPLEDVHAELTATGTTEEREELGSAEIFDVRAGSATARKAARRYGKSPVEKVRRLVRLEWDAMSEWLEEDEPVYTHPRDPYTRLDILASSRRVRVEVDGMIVADSQKPVILFETGLPPRYYLPLSDLHQEMLRASASKTHCPYKGEATYFSVDTGKRVHQDLVWIYRSPLPECVKIAGLACFYNERVELHLDGVLQPRPGRPGP
jgi:uncharacterized protein (DUF427 family)